MQQRLPDNSTDLFTQCFHATVLGKTRVIWNDFEISPCDYVSWSINHVAYQPILARHTCGFISSLQKRSMSLWYLTHEHILPYSVDPGVHVDTATVPVRKSVDLIVGRPISACKSMGFMETASQPATSASGQKPINHKPLYGLRVSDPIKELTFLICTVRSLIQCYRNCRSLVGLTSQSQSCSSCAHHMSTPRAHNPWSTWTEEGLPLLRSPCSYRAALCCVRKLYLGPGGRMTPVSFSLEGSKLQDVAIWEKNTSIRWNPTV